MTDSAVSARKKADALDLGSVAICSVVWGTTWFAITMQLGVVPPAVSIVYRFGLAALLLLGWLALRRQPMRLTRAQHVAVFAQGLFTFTLQYGLVYMAEARIASAVVAVAFAGSAYVNLVLFRLALGQRAARGAWAGAALGLLGVAALSWDELARASFDARAIAGVAMAAGAVLLAAIGSLAAYRAQRLEAPLTAATGWAMAYGTGVTALFVIATGTPWRFEATAEYVGSLLYLSVFGSVLTFLVFFGLARRRGFGFAAYIGAMTPPIAMGVSALFEEARFGWAAALGLVLVLAGQALLIRAPR